MSLIKVKGKITSFNKLLKYKSFIICNSFNFKKYSNIAINYSNEIFKKNKFIILQRLIAREKCDQILNYIYSRPVKKIKLNGSLIEYEFDLTIISDEIEQVRKIISNQQGFDVDVAYDEITLYETSRIEKEDSSFLWHRDGHFERYKLQILLSNSSEHSALEIDLSSHKLNLQIEYEETRFRDYLPKNSIKFTGTIGDGAVFSTSFIHRIGNCKKEEKRLVLTIPFLSEKKYL
jgi:hypothetical protein